MVSDCNPGPLSQSRDFGIENPYPGIPGLIPGLEFQIYVGKLAVSRIVGKAYYRPTDSKGLISV
jgi:hypothetical protein